MQDVQHWCNESDRLRRTGDLHGAVAAAKRALSLDDASAVAWALTAHASRQMGDIAQASSAAERAVDCDDRHAPGWFNLGATLVARGRVDEAISAYRRAIALDDAHAEAWSNLGGLLGAKGDHDGEIDAYRKAVAAKPGLVPLWNNLGDALRARGLNADAEAALRKAVEIEPSYAAAWINLGLLLRDTGRYEESLEACSRGVELDERSPEAWSNLGNAYLDLERYDDAVTAHRRADTLRPNDPTILFNLGVALKAAGDARAAVQTYRAALALPNAASLGNERIADLHWNHALALLTLGQFPDGWSEYEWRWRRSKADSPRHPLPVADIGTKTARRLLVWGEQGVGDEILYAGLIGDAAAGGHHVTLECDPRLERLFRRSMQGLEIRSRGTIPTASDFDLKIPAASLGRWYRTSFSDFPRRVNYLVPDDVARNNYRSRLKAGSSAPVVGMSWRSRNREYGAFKSSELTAWAPLFAAGDFHWVNLQYGETDADIGQLERSVGIRPTEIEGLDRYNDIDGLAALIGACDLVITVSNVTAHIAGALGVPVWLLLPKARGKIWYWFEDRDDSPWYPSMRIFRQPRAGAWPDVMSRVAEALGEGIYERR